MLESEAEVVESPSFAVTIPHLSVDRQSLLEAIDGLVKAPQAGVGAADLQVDCPGGIVHLADGPLLVRGRIAGRAVLRELMFLRREREAPYY